jgi:hypothetical protein
MGWCGLPLSKVEQNFLFHGNGLSASMSVNGNKRLYIGIMPLVLITLRYLILEMYFNEMCVGGTVCTVIKCFEA